MFKQPSKVFLEGHEAAKRGTPEYCVPEQYRFTDAERDWVNGHVSYWLEVEN